MSKNHPTPWRVDTPSFYDGSVWIVDAQRRPVTKTGSREVAEMIVKSVNYCWAMFDHQPPGVAPHESRGADTP